MIWPIETLVLTVERRSALRKDTTISKDKVSQNIQYCECHGFGYIHIECPNYKRTKGKVMNASLSNTESKSNDSAKSSSSKENVNFMYFASSVEGNYDSSCKNMYAHEYVSRYEYENELICN